LFTSLRLTEYDTLVYSRNIKKKDAEANLILQVLTVLVVN